MARKLNGFPAGGKAPRYPDEWFDGSIWEITPGEDTRSKTPEIARRILLAAALNRQLRLKSCVHDGKVYIQATGTRPA